MKKFVARPQSVTYTDLEHILVHLGFEKIPAKGSHVKFKHRKLQNDIVIPVHNKECKPFYKQQAKKQISSLTKYL
jgi:predicted RNA binding protein YcfA (HicA-like mRNA interferase family)